MIPFRRSHRALIMGRRGAVATNHPVATQAGLDTLRAGGNAADATAAISLTLGVVEPHMSGLGGDGFYHVWMAAAGKGTVYNGTGVAPAAATPDKFADGMAVNGPRSVSVPGLLAGIGMMHAAHGVLPWARVVQPAIAAARDGFAATHGYRTFSGNARQLLRADPRSGATFLHEGEVPALGDLIVQPDLAATLETIAADGAETFYRGRLARLLAEGLAEAGTLIGAADLADLKAEEQAPIGITYRGYEVRQTPPNSTGFVLLEELKILEQFDLTAVAHDSAELIHLLVEAKKHAFLDRERYGMDPRFGTVPLDRILSEAQARANAAKIDRARAASLPLSFEAPNEGDTTYFCVVDADGNAVSAIQSINSAFGSGVTAGRTGILLNNRMAYWHLDPRHPNVLVPGKRVRHTMNAPMILKDGKPWAVLGTPGADNQVQVNLQAVVNLIDYGVDPQHAAEAPRWTSSQPGQGANWPHAGDEGLTIEEGLPEATYAGLRAKGHDLRTVAPLEGACSLECIRILDNGVRMAGSDPRRDGWAGAY